MPNGHVFFVELTGHSFKSGDAPDVRTAVAEPLSAPVRVAVSGGVSGRRLGEGGAADGRVASSGSGVGSSGTGVGSSGTGVGSCGIGEGTSGGGHRCYPGFMCKHSSVECKTCAI